MNHISMNIRLFIRKNSIFVAIALTICLIGVSALLTFLGKYEALSFNNMKEQTARVDNKINKMFYYVTQMDTGIRGFLITPDDEPRLGRMEADAQPRSGANPDATPRAHLPDDRAVTGLCTDQEAIIVREGDLLHGAHLQIPDQDARHARAASIEQDDIAATAGDGDGHLQREPDLAALRRAADKAHRLRPPQRGDQPGGLSRVPGGSSEARRLGRCATSAPAPPADRG